MSVFDDLNKNTNELERITSDFAINEKVIEFGNRIIQLCNVESVAITEAPKQAISIAPFIGIILGIVLFQAQPIAGILLIGVCSYYVYNIYEKNKNKGKNLFIHLNSGHYIVINILDHDFCYEVLRTIEKYMNGLEKGKINIHVADSTVTFGDGSSINMNK